MAFAFKKFNSPSFDSYQLLNNSKNFELIKKDLYSHLDIPS